MKENKNFQEHCLKCELPFDRKEMQMISSKNPNTGIFTTKFCCPSCLKNLLVDHQNYNFIKMLRNDKGLNE